MSLSSFLQLIRWKNVALMSYLLILLNWIMIPHLGGNGLEISLFTVFSIAILAVLAAGNCINDIYDCRIDRINKPNRLILVNEELIDRAKRIYKILNVLGIGSGIWFSMQIRIPELSFIFIGAALLLYYYSKKLKPKLLIGNILVSVLVMLPILILTEVSMKFIPLEIIVFACLVFLLNLVREILKDCQDIKGDYKYDCKTLPIVLGTTRTVTIVKYLLGFIILVLVAILYLTNNNTYLKVYIFTFLIMPLIWIVHLLNQNKTIWNFKRLSTYLKWLFFMGVNSIYFI